MAVDAGGESVAGPLHTETHRLIAVVAQQVHMHPPHPVGGRKTAGLGGQGRGGDGQDEQAHKRSDRDHRRYSPSPIWM